MEFSLTDLVCHEDFLKKSELGEEEEEEDDPFTTVSESDDKYIQLLIEEETVLDFNGSVFENEKDGHYSLHSDSWLKCARLGAINWVLSFKDCKPQELASTATELILAVPKEINLMDFRPSVIAFAAILAASDDQLTRNAMEIKMSVIPSLGSLPKDDVHSCYNLMLEIKMEKSSTPKSVVLSPNSSPVDVRENPLITSAVGTKRRLTYNGCDQNCPNLKNHRP
ncbi:hypothetical protein RHGRI_029223 [Rhododendron griersonianum]|uniref:Cyclin C-terminal domain-containing protein n=1 Tax=Rhododendron griersonianum TaxID=479676 RepID=A0AAV6ILQ9_9ERIC|nr:hypothetical protein RHGRI_029223 [Rhododendron griersonianum]